MTPERLRNLRKLPIVLLVRLPILLPFYILSRVGEIAETVGQMIARRLPAFEEEP